MWVGDAGSNRVWLNDGIGTFTNSGQSLGNSWSTCSAPGEVDRDNDVDGQDLALLFGNWLACPG